MSTIYKGTCFYCRFAESIGDDAVRCRRYAPRPGQGRNGWPIVWEEDWCGEWDEKIICKCHWFGELKPEAENDE